MKNRIVKSLVAALLAAVIIGGGVNAAFANPTAIGNAKNAAKKKAAKHPKTVRVTVNKNGFSPSTIEVEKGYPVTLIFRRADAKNCGNRVVFPSLNITRNLPVGKAVTVKFTPDKTGDISFTCGMGMYKGNIVVE
jgi:plastocyanin domain-containing protein